MIAKESIDYAARVFYLYVSAIDIGGGIGEYIEVLLNPWSLGGDAAGPGCSAGAGAPRRWFLNFSSLLHLALRFENHTWILASGRPIFAANLSRAKTSG